MPRHTPSLLAYAAIFALGAPAQQPDYSGEAFVVEQLTTDAAFLADGTGQEETAMRVRIQSSAGVQRFAVLKLPYRGANQRVEVEVRNAQELDEALQYGAEAILLNNMSPKDVKRSVDRIKKATEGQAERWIPTEASGGIVLENIRAYAETGVDFISVGALTHSAKAADISMRIEAE